MKEKRGCLCSISTKFHLTREGPLGNKTNKKRQKKKEKALFFCVWRSKLARGLFEWKFLYVLEFHTKILFGINKLEPLDVVFFCFASGERKVKKKEKFNF